jgi:VWFA-related protein
MDREEIKRPYLFEKLSQTITLFFVTAVFVLTAHAQSFQKEFVVSQDAKIEITNLDGQIKVSTDETQTDKITLSAVSSPSVTEKDLTINSTVKSLVVLVNQTDKNRRIDLTLKVPPRLQAKITTDEGEVTVRGNFAAVEVLSNTGTIYADVPLDALKYHFLWTESRPRYLSDAELTKVKEKAGGKFVLEGGLGEAKEKSKKDKSKKPEDEKQNDSSESDDQTTETTKDTQSTSESVQLTADDNSKDKKKKDQKKKNKNPKNEKLVSLDFTTKRGIILLNVPPSEVPSDLRERPLTEATKAVVRSGDSILVEAIRKTSPKFFGDYAKTLPQRRREPNIVEASKNKNNTNNEYKRINVSVTDKVGRAVNGLQPKDFSLFIGDKQTEILDVQPSTAPFNLILLLDVSGSVEERIDFIRKAARNFINTVSPQDKIAVIVFRDDVQVLSNFTTDKKALSAALDTFEAGGGTALYDALAYSFVEMLKPLRGDRTAIVVLSDGDDNRSFLPFDSILNALYESGALVYPLYIPSALIPSNNVTEATLTVDPLRTRYLTLTTRAETEAKRLAEVSGGIYYPITQLDQLQKAYDDVVAQLRMAYTITFRANANLTPRLRVKVNRDNAFTKPGSIFDVPANEVQKYLPKTEEAEEQVDDGVIRGEVDKIIYQQFLADTLREVKLEGLNINTAPTSFILNNGAEKIAISRWVSPKRTRSYPYERVYNTLTLPKRATVIPVLKDEGQKGDRDFLQFDTFSLMSLLEVYVIPAYYKDALKATKDGKITEQKFDNEYVVNKLKELQNFKGTVLEWNLKEMQNIKDILEKAKISYQEISKKTGVTMHDEDSINELAAKLNTNLTEFIAFSRLKSQNAQNREFVTFQPKEALSTETKGRVTISDRNGGKYFFTCDETKIEDQTVYLIEDKHSARAKIPSANDIKDGLLKMMIYANLKNVKIGKNSFTHKSYLRLTSAALQSSVSSEDSDEKVIEFAKLNQLTVAQTNFIKKLFAEARANKLVIKFEQAETMK